MLSARAAKCLVSGLGRWKGAFRSISFAMTRSRRALPLQRRSKKCSPRGVTLVRVVAIVALSLHVMPLGLPLFCDTDRRCDEQMPMSMPSGPTIDQTSSATDCATSVFCAAMGTAALILSTPVSMAVSDSYVVAFDV